MFVLYENDVLDFDELVIVFFGVIGRVFLDVIFVIVENFGIGIIRVSWFYLLEVIWGCDVDDLIFGYIDFFLDFKGFVVGVVDCGIEFVFWDIEFFGD